MTERGIVVDGWLVYTDREERWLVLSERNDAAYRRELAAGRVNCALAYMHASERCWQLATGGTR